MIARRLFLGAILGAPAIVRSGILMPINPRLDGRRWMTFGASQTMRGDLGEIRGTFGIGNTMLSPCHSAEAAQMAAWLDNSYWSMEARERLLALGAKPATFNMIRRI